MCQTFRNQSAVWCNTVERSMHAVYMCIDGVFINIYIYVYLNINTPGFRENVRQTFGSHPPFMSLKERAA